MGTHNSKASSPKASLHVDGLTSTPSDSDNGSRSVLSTNGVAAHKTSSSLQLERTESGPSNSPYSQANSAATGPIPTEAQSTPEPGTAAAGKTALFDAGLLDTAIVEEALKSGLRIRPLCCDDHAHGHLDLLSQLTSTGLVSPQDYIARFELMRATPNTYFVVVIEDVETQQIMATGTVVIEAKFTHGCGKVAHIEDIVTATQRRGQHLGKRVIQQLIYLSKVLGCYKIILDCSEKNEGFYANLGFQRKENQMALYF